MDDTTKQGIGIALNEATLLGAEVSRERRVAALTFDSLSLPIEGDTVGKDARVSIVLAPVGRVVASLRDARWDDDAAPPVPFALDQLLSIVQSFGGLPVYGWAFIDVEDGYKRWAKRLSVDERLGDEGHSHSITLFQEGSRRHLNFRIWFDSLRVFRPDQTEIPIGDFVVGGKRWWDRMHAGDKRTEGHGIFQVGTPLPKKGEN